MQQIYGFIVKVVDSEIERSSLELRKAGIVSLVVLEQRLVHLIPVEASVFVAFPRVDCNAMGKLPD